MEDIFRIIEAITYDGKKALATIVRVEGSAYKKEGSSMLFLEDGSQVGMLSAGCLEEDLSAHVKKVLKKEEPLIIHYDLRKESDEEWGQGPGCNGIIEVFIEPVTMQLEENLLKLKVLLDSGQPVINLKKINSLEEYLFIPKRGKPFGNWKDDIPVNLDENKSGIVRDHLYQHVYQPRPRLLVFGAGKDAIPLVKLAKSTGFSVIVCDWREKYCHKGHFPDADSLVVGFPKEILQTLQITAYDHIVIMSHQFQRDQEILQSLLDKRLRYLGVLGPVERTNRLLKGKNKPCWLHSPAGIGIGGKGPEEIAVSIVAEMIQSLRKHEVRKVKNLWMIPD